MAKTGHTKQILVYADWIDLDDTILMGTLQADQVRGKEVFSFSYTKDWLEKGPALMMDLELAREVSAQFRINAQKREAVIKRVEKAVSQWKEIAKKIGISRNEIHFMEPTFEK